MGQDFFYRPSALEPRPTAEYSDSSIKDVQTMHSGAGIQNDSPKQSQTETLRSVAPETIQEEKNNDNNSEEGLSLQEKVQRQNLMKKIESMEKEVGGQKQVEPMNPPKRERSEWYLNWICSNCGRMNLIDQEKCMACGLDVRSSFSLGRQKGTVSQEEERFYYEMIVPRQTQEKLRQQQERIRDEDRQRQRQEFYANQEPTDGRAVASLVLSLVALFIPTVASKAGTTTKDLGGFIAAALVLSLLALICCIGPIRDRKKGKGMAIAGLVLGIIGMFYLGSMFLAYKKAEDRRNNPEKYIDDALDRLDEMDWY